MLINLYYIAKMESKNKYPTIPELEVKKLDETTEERYCDLIKASEIKDLSPIIEVWTSSCSNKTLAYSSHGIFRYFGKFPPPIARHLICTFTKENELVLDPMCGSGTTALESLLLNRRATCYDVNPLSTLLTKVKTTRLKKSKYLEALNNVLLNVEISEIESLRLIGIKNQNHWFLEETTLSLSRIKHAIETVDMDKDTRDALKIAFMGIIRRVSRATTQQGRLFLDEKTAVKDAVPFFEKKAKAMIESISELPLKKNKINISQKSILANINKKEELTKLIICHPPYFNAYKYSGVNSLELAWLGIDHADIRKHEVREAFKVGKPEKVNDYIEDMSKGLINLGSYLENGGHMAVMIGDTVMKGQYIPVTKMLLDKISNIYKVEKAAIRIPQFTEASWAASQRRNSSQVGINLCDFVIILRKK